MGGEKEGSRNREKVRPKKKEGRKQKKEVWKVRNKQRRGIKMCRSTQHVVCSLSTAAAATQSENAERCNQTGMRDGDLLVREISREVICW